MSRVSVGEAKQMPMRWPIACSDVIRGEVSQRAAWLCSTRDAIRSRRSCRSCRSCAARFPIPVWIHGASNDLSGGVPSPQPPITRRRVEVCAYTASTHPTHRLRQTVRNHPLPGGTHRDRLCLSVRARTHSQPTNDVTNLTRASNRDPPTTTVRVRVPVTQRRPSRLFK